MNRVLDIKQAWLLQTHRDCFCDFKVSFSAQVLQKFWLLTRPYLGLVTHILCSQVLIYYNSQRREEKEKKLIYSKIFGSNYF